MTTPVALTAEQVYDEESLVSEFVNFPRTYNLISNFGDIKFEDDDQNPDFYAKLQYTGGGMLAAGLVVGVRWISGSREKIVHYKLPNAWGWAARTIRKQGRDGVAFSAEDLGSPRGGSLLKDLVVFTRDDTYGIWNGTNYNSFLIWESTDRVSGGGYYLPAKRRAYMYPGPIEILYGEVEPN